MDALNVVMCGSGQQDRMSAKSEKIGIEPGESNCNGHDIYYQYQDDPLMI